MDIRLLFKMLDEQGSRIYLNQEILGDDIASQLMAVFNAPGLFLSSPTIHSNIEQLVQDRTKRENRMPARDYSKKRALDSGESKAPKKVRDVDEEGQGNTENYRWTRFDFRETAETSVQDPESAVFRFHNRNKTHGRIYLRKRPIQKPFIVLNGQFITESPVGKLALDVHAKFWGNPWEAEFEIEIRGFPVQLRDYLLPGIRDAAHLNNAVYLDDIALRLSSGPFNSYFFGVPVPLERGVNLLARIILPQNLHVMAGMPPLLVACGSAVLHRYAPPEIDLNTYPPLNFNLQTCTLTHAFFSLRSRIRQTSGPDPTDAEPGSTGGDPAGPELITEFAAAGHWVVEQTPALFWTDIPHDMGILSFALRQPRLLRRSNSGYGLSALKAARQPVHVCALSSLDEFAGGSAWRDAYQHPQHLAAGHPYIVEQMVASYDLHLRQTVNVFIHVRSSCPFTLWGLEQLQIQPYFIGWNIRRTVAPAAVLVTAAGILRGLPMKLHAVVEHPSFAIYAWDDNAVFGQDLANDPVLSGMQITRTGEPRESYTGVYIDFRFGHSGYMATAAGTGGEGPDEINWVR